jgi:hypothetical protein
VSHEISLAVWDLPSPTFTGRRAKLKVGVSCPGGCDLSGSIVNIYTETGTRIGEGTMGSKAWPATTALYWVELELNAPEREGDLSLDIHVTPTLPHAEATSVVTLTVSSPPEHRVTLHVIDKSTGAPLAGVDLRLGRFRATTDSDGIAHVEVPGGRYDMATWKSGYEVLSQTATIVSDTTVHLRLTAEPEVGRPYWM